LAIALLLRRLCPAGTIMQNDWDELFAVLDLLVPHCLGEYGGFVEYYSKPIKRGQSSTASEYEVVKVCVHDSNGHLEPVVMAHGMLGRADGQL
jgi:SNF2 family DNA or RNA helicase